MPGRQYFELVTVGSITIYAGTGVPGFTAAQGSIFVRTDVAEIYQNTDGAGTWVAIGGGGGSGLPFVATNEFYIDTTAVADVTNRIYPTVEAALDAAASLPANAAVVIRLREGQSHPWDMSTGTAADGSRNISFYSHAKVDEGATIMSLSGSLPAPVAATPRYMTFRNMRISKFNSIFTMDAPWNFEFDDCVFQAGIDMQLDSTVRDIDLVLNNCDAVEEDTQGGLPTTQPLRLLLDQGGTNTVKVECINCRIDLFNRTTDPTPPHAIGASPAGDRFIDYVDCTLRVLGAGSIDGQRTDVGPQWTLTGAAGGTLRVEFRNTNIEVVAGANATLFDPGDPSNSIEVLWNNVDLSVRCAGDGESVTHTNFTFGTRTDGEDVFTPLENPNRVTFLRSWSENGGRTPGFPIDPPNGCVGYSPSEFASQNHQTAWQAVTVDFQQATEQTFWAGADGATIWQANTTNGSTSELLRMIYQDLEHRPIGVDVTGQFRVTMFITGANITGGASFRVDAIVTVSGGTIAVLSQSSTTLTDTTAGAMSAVVSADNVNNGIACTVDQGASGIGNVNWQATSYVQRLVR